MWMRLLSAAMRVISQQLQINLLPFHSLSPNLRVHYHVTKSTKLKRKGVLAGVRADVLANSSQDRRQIKQVKVTVCRIKVVKAL